jgi:integrase/recombinase XerD
LRALIGTCKGDKVIPLRDKAILLMLLETGLRQSELSDLALIDVNVREGNAIVKRGKGGRGRVVIFGPATSDALRKYLRAVRQARIEHWSSETGPLFLNRYGEKLGYSGIGVMVKARGRQAGIPDLHAHMLRHAWTHYCLNSGVGDQNVITLAGWTSPRQLARYGRAMAVQRAMTAGRAHPVAAVLRQR